MRRLLLFILCLISLEAHAHLGSPDIFYDGMAGPYSARVTIRMPTVIPGRAEISARIATGEPVEVSFLPVYSSTPITNSPPPDIARLVLGETNLYSGELWLMRFGAYSVNVHVKGPQGEGTAEIPVMSEALSQLPMPSLLGKILLVMATILVVGGIAIAVAAAREAALPAGAKPGLANLIKGTIAALAAAAIFALSLIGGNSWWHSTEQDFRRHLREGAWPDLAADVHIDGSDRILQLELGKEFFKQNHHVPLIPDHGKMMHLFLVREGTRDAFAHLHPIHTEGNTYEVALPPLPEGRYDIFCDVTFEGGTSSTATNSVLIPAVPTTANSPSQTVKRDPDDSWARFANDSVPAADNTAPIFRMPDGTQVTWKCQKPLRANHDASLRFSVTDAEGHPVALEPYMGMLSHAAVLRSDNAVFSHLHPSGNFSMAAQMFFAKKMAPNENTGMGDMADMPDMANMPGMDHSMHHLHSADAVSEIDLPYEFPAPGNYRIWVQFKIGEQVVTGVFDAQVGS